MISNKQQRIVDKKDNFIVYHAYATNMTFIDYACYDTLIPKDQQLRKHITK